MVDELKFASIPPPALSFLLPPSAFTLQRSTFLRLPSFPMPATVHRRPSRCNTTLVALLFAWLVAGTTQAAGPSMTDAPILDFRLALFDEVSGLKTSDLRGSTGIYHSSELIEMRDFTLTLLRRDGTNSLQVKSPKALVHLNSRRAEGDESIEVSGPNFSITGLHWTCDEPAKAVTIREQARVVFSVPLIDILK